MNKTTMKKLLVTNIGIIFIIAFAYAMAFFPIGSMLHSNPPVLKGCTGNSNIALQIVVGDESDVAAYMDVLDDFGAKGTFFFCEQCGYNEANIVQEVEARGHGIGYYSCDDGQRVSLYIGGGYSLPVMSYKQGSGRMQVGPSIDISKLKKLDDWTKVLAERISDDMFLYIDADNDFAEFKKTVQIVQDRGYTILKIDEMI